MELNWASEKDAEIWENAVKEIEYCKFLWDYDNLYRARVDEFIDIFEVEVIDSLLRAGDENYKYTINDVAKEVKQAAAQIETMLVEFTAKHDIDPQEASLGEPDSYREKHEDDDVQNLFEDMFIEWAVLDSLYNDLYTYVDKNDDF